MIEHSRNLNVFLSPTRLLMLWFLKGQSSRVMATIYDRKVITAKCLNVGVFLYMHCLCLYIVIYVLHESGLGTATAITVMKDLACL